MKLVETSAPATHHTPDVLGTPARLTAVALLALLGWAAIVAPGCRGHGDYTKEHVSGAKKKMDALKSGTEWQMAHQAFLAGDLDKAMRHCDYSISLNDNVARSHVLRGRIFMEMGNLEQSSIAFSKAETLDPVNVDTQYFQGILAERLTRTQDALTRYQKAAELDPSNSQYPVAAAEMLIDLNRIADAKAYLVASRDRFDHSAGICQTLGQIALLENDAEGAAKLFYEASLLAPENQAIIEDLANAQITLGKFAEAETILARMVKVEKNSDRRDLRHLRARCLTQLNRPVEARTIYLDLTADEQGGSDVEAWIGLAELSHTLRDNQRLKTSATRLIAIAPERSEGFSFMGLHYKKAGNLQAAAQNFDKAVQIEGSPQHLLLLGMTLQEMGRPDDARRCYSAAQSLDPANTTAGQLLTSLERGSAVANVTTE